MDLRRCTAIVCLFGLASTALAQWSQHGVWVPGFQEPMPRYWTGTLNLARGTAVSEGGWIDAARLYIKAAGDSWGTPVRQWVDDPDPGGPMSMGLDVAFDSTQFNDGDVVLFTFAVLDYVGVFYPQWKDATGFAVVHNKSFAYQHSDFLAELPESDGATPANSAFGYMNYIETIRSASGWTQERVEADSNDAAILYFNTHGNVNTIETDVGSYTFNSQNVESWRQNINGSGWPPLNSTGKPLTQYVHIDACLSGSDNSFTTWFWPYYRHYFPPSGPDNAVTNQALFGYAGLIFWDDRQRQASLYWPMLKAGRTVVEMRDNLVEFCNDYWDIYGERYISIERPTGTVSHVDEAGDCPVWGDFYTRLKGVYTGNTTWPVGWYRDL